MKYITYPFAKKENLQENYLIATYKVFGITGSNVLDKIGGFAVGQSVGTWVKVPGITDEMVEKYQARVIFAEDVSNECESVFIIKIAFPTANFGGSFAQLLTSVLGNDVSTSLQVRLIDLELCNDAATDLGYVPKNTSPIDKLRNITGVENRPLILNMIKPCLGFTSDVGAKFFYDVALGGVDLIKDDELLSCPNYNLITDRIVAYEKASQKAQQITGKKTIYIPNITNSPKKMCEAAKIAVDQGIKACLINYVFTGFDSFAEICHEFSDDLFIMGHYAGVGIMSGKKSGVSNSVYLGTLPRLAGADAIMTMFANKNNVNEVIDYYKTVQAQQLTMKNISPIVTTVGGGITPNDIKGIVDEVGRNVIIGIGGAIQGHPSGTTAGAQAAMHAVEAVASGLDLHEAAKTCPALAESIRLWEK